MEPHQSKKERLINLPEPSLQVEGFQQVRQAHRLELIEDYVELISDLLNSTGKARQVDIAQRLGVAQPTVAKMLKRLEAEGYVTLRLYQGANITPKGEKLAKFCRQRHNLVTQFLLALGVDEKTALCDAEGIEHHVSETTLQAFEEFLKKEKQFITHITQHSKT